MSHIVEVKARYAMALTLRILLMRAGEALVGSPEAALVTGVIVSLNDPEITAVDAASNLQFLGIDPHATVEIYKSGSEKSHG